MLAGLGICYPIKDYWSHCFTASTCTHYTSTPLFQWDGKVYVRIDGAHVFAWGKLGPSNGTTSHSSTCKRNCRPGDEIYQKNEKLVVIDHQTQNATRGGLKDIKSEQQMCIDVDRTTEGTETHGGNATLETDVNNGEVNGEEINGEVSGNQTKDASTGELEDFACVMM